MARFGHLKALLFSFVCLLAFAFTANAQTPAPTPHSCVAQPRTTRGTSPVNPAFIAPAIFDINDFHTCPKSSAPKKNRNNARSADGDIVYLNAGSQQGIKEGQNFQIIRPRGDVKGVHKQKNGFLGTYIQDVGQLQVFKVRENTSAAQITFTCDMVLLRRSARADSRSRVSAATRRSKPGSFRRSYRQTDRPFDDGER